jgi:putative oxidoreductase
MKFEFIDDNRPKFYFVFRVLVGLLFMQHGLQKLFGMLGGNQVELMSLMGFAGFIELVGGGMIAIGLFTRLVAGVAGIEMLAAFFKAHFPRGWIPIENGGELALLYFACFMVLVAYGSGIWAFDKKK